MNWSDLPRFEVLEVHNFGGFFGGDTVTLEATQLAAGTEPRTLVIDEKALDNIADRHKVAPGMVFALQMDGERVDHAILLAAASHADLRSALGPATIAGPLAEPTVLSARCPRCERWVSAEVLAPGGCGVCG